MGKYMRKAKITGDVAVMDVTQSSLGVRTRAKTLALQRLQSSPSSATAPPPSPDPDSCYLQLRSRRLEKLCPNLPEVKKQPKDSCRADPQTDTCKDSSFRSNSGLRINYFNADFGASESVKRSEKEVCNDAANRGYETEEGYGLSIEASFGENNCDSEPRDRTTRESTPCSTIRNADTITTPGSTTRRRNVDAVTHRNQNAILRDIPSVREMEEFFAREEQHQQQTFIEKYNFDFVNEVPLPGRYEWLRVSL